jgi:hypothetical protein
MAARLDVERKAGGYTDRARAYKVLLDGTEVGRIKAGESYGADVPPGHHEVQIAIDWGRSPVVELDLAEGESARLHCQPNANPLTVLWYTTFARKRYVALERTA